MPGGIELKKADLVLQWDLVTPTFELLTGTSPFYKRAFERLKPHGLRASDMRILYGETGNIGTVSLDCRLTADDMLVRFGLERLELIATDCLRIPTGTVFGVALDAARALKDTFPEATFKSFSVTFG